MINNCFRARSQCLPGEPLDDSPLPKCPIRNIVQTDRDKQLSPRSAGPRRWHSCDVWSLDTPRLGQKVSKEPRAVTSPAALLCRYRRRLLLAEIPKGVDRNSGLKLPLPLWESGHINALIGLVLGQQNSLAERQGGCSHRQTNSGKWHVP